MSEDALSWNFFVGLAEAGQLRHVVQFLTGRTVVTEPSLYLWGELIDLKQCKRERFQPLDMVRNRIEHDIKRFKTEPDIMLVIHGQLIICVEAKFSSGNPLSHEGEVKDGQKPTDRTGLLWRYLDQATVETKRIIDGNGIGEIFHSQLFRNVVFASEMANGSDWHVVNLVSKTQWNCRKDTKGYSFVNPEAQVRAYLNKNHQHCFSFHYWEELYKKLVKNYPELGQLNTYICSKSAHYRKAFDLS
jgi:hypothetical protein